MSNSNKILLVSGCSFTFGEEIYDAVYEPGNIHSSKHAWPNVYADLAGYKNVVNVSEPGASNHYIARSIINRATEMRDAGIEFDIAVMWTFLHRGEIYVGEWDQLGLWHTSKQLFETMCRHLSAEYWSNSTASAEQLVKEFCQLKGIAYNKWYLGYNNSNYRAHDFYLFGWIEDGKAGIAPSEFPHGPNGHPLEQAQAHAARILHEKWRTQ